MNTQSDLVEVLLCTAELFLSRLRPPIADADGNSRESRDLRNRTVPFRQRKVAVRETTPRICGPFIRRTTRTV